MGRSSPTTAFDGAIRYFADTMYTLNICTKEFIIFVCTDSTEIFLSKLRSSCLNYNLPSVFTDSYCGGGGGGVSSKHCLLTFFILLVIPLP